MRTFLCCLLSAIIAAHSPRVALAQPQVSLPFGYIDTEPDRLVGEAFSSPFGELLIQEFATAIHEGADSACLKEKAIDAASLAGSARTILLRHGAQLIQSYRALIDQAAFNAKFGEAARAELNRLRENAEVRALLDLAAPIGHSGVILAVVERVDRYVLIQKINLSRRFSPIATGDVRLLEADPTDVTMDKLDAFLAANKSAAITRYLELAETAQKVLDQSIDTKRILGIRIVDLMPGLDRDMAAVCVLARK